MGRLSLSNTMSEVRGSLVSLSPGMWVWDKEEAGAAGGSAFPLSSTGNPSQEWGLVENYFKVQALLLSSLFKCLQYIFNIFCT